MAHFPSLRRRNHAVAEAPAHPSLDELLEADPDGPVADHLDECEACADLLATASPMPALDVDWPSAPAPTAPVLPEVNRPKATAARFSRGVVSGRRRDWIAYTAVVLAATGTGLAAGLRGLWRLTRRRH